MSRHNRQKRAAKQKARRRAASQHEHRDTEPGHDRVALLDHLVAALYASATCPEHDADVHAAELIQEFSGCTRDLDTEVNRLIDVARHGGLRPTELMGSTFTVSNFGALGLDDGVPVINYPEAAILGMGSLKPRAVVIDDEVVARPTMSLTCAFDHRIADGAEVAAFLGELRALIETPELALADL